MANTTWNPADLINTTVSASNLLATANAGTFNGGVRSVDAQAAGKYYFELAMTTLNQVDTVFGIANASAVLSSVITSSAVNACYTRFNGSLYYNGTTTGISLGTLSPTTSRVCIALDMTGKLLWMRYPVTGNWNGSGSANPATGVGGLSISAIAGVPIYALFAFATAGSAGSTEQCTANFGDSAFLGTVPSGFTAGFPAGGGGGAAAAQARAVIMA